MSEKLDDLDYHADSAAEAGLSEYAGGAHIAYFLVWAVTHDLVAPDDLDAVVTDQVTDRGRSAFEAVLDWYDGTLTVDSFREEGAAFAVSCYNRYVDRYEAEFEVYTYHEPNWQDYARASGLLDALRRTGCV